MRPENIHPLTKHLRENRGMNTRGWMRFNNLNIHNAQSTIYNGYYDPETVKKLREDGLYEFLTPIVRARIEEAEKTKLKGNGGHE